LLDQDGNFLGKQFVIRSVAVADFLFTPVATYNSRNNQYLVAYVYRRHQGLIFFLSGRLIGNDGRLKGNTFSFSMSSLPVGGIRNPSIIYNSQTDEYLAAWERGTTIYGQIVKSDGSRAGENFMISANALFPMTVYNGQNNHYLAVWQDT